jgi:hypothetical protein
MTGTDIDIALTAATAGAAAGCIVTGVAGEPVPTGRGLIAAGAETPLAIPSRSRRRAAVTRDMARHEPC